LLHESLLEIINKCVGIDEVLKGFTGERKEVLSGIGPGLDERRSRLWLIGLS
jgi:hypothetical protein